MKIELQKLPPNPLISIVVPSYNQGSFIKQTINSILEQNYRPIEILVVDGASKDETVDVLKSYHEVTELHWWSEPDSGVVEAVNKGIERAHGKIGAIQSSDDYYQPSAFSKAVNIFLSDPSLGFLFGDIIKIDSYGKELLKTNFGSFSIEKFLSSQIWIPQPSTFFRMDLAKDLGGWRKEVSYAADTDLWLRMMLCSNVKKVNQILATRRMHKNQRDKHGENIIRDYSRTIYDFFELYKAPKTYLKAAKAGIFLKKNRYFYNEDQSVKNIRTKNALKIYPPLKDYLSPHNSLLKTIISKCLGPY